MLEPKHSSGSAVAQPNIRMPLSAFAASQPSNFIVLMCVDISGAIMSVQVSGGGGLWMTVSRSFSPAWNHFTMVANSISLSRGWLPFGICTRARKRRYCGSHVSPKAWRRSPTRSPEAARPSS